MFFRILLVILLVYLVVRFFQNLFPSSTSGRNDTNASKEKEGNVTVNSSPGNGKTISRDEGEYVDFEEVDDK
jgi:hypothetical protein